MASVSILAPYLAAGIEVENPAWERGTLVGLPYCTPYDRSPAGPFADVRYDFPPPDTLSSGVVALAKVTPVLYAPEDRVRVVAAHPLRAQLVDVLRLPIAELHRMAAIVDQARAAGIALNLPPTAYRRKDVPRA